MITTKMSASQGFSCGLHGDMLSPLEIADILAAGGMFYQGYRYRVKRVKPDYGLIEELEYVTGMSAAVPGQRQKALDKIKAPSDYESEQICEDKSPKELPLTVDYFGQPGIVNIEFYEKGNDTPFHVEKTRKMEWTWIGNKFTGPVVDIRFDQSRYNVHLSFTADGMVLASKNNWRFQDGDRFFTFHKNDILKLTPTMLWRQD